MCPAIIRWRVVRWGVVYWPEHRISLLMVLYNLMMAPNEFVDASLLLFLFFSFLVEL